MGESHEGATAAGGVALASQGNGGARPEGADDVEVAVQMTLDARDVSDPALMPQMTGAAIDELKTYQSLFILETIGDRPPGAAAPSPIGKALDPFAKPPAGQDLPAIGVLTTHKQSWTQQGLALGNLLHSVCLAPGEVTQVAVVDWQRQNAGRSAETTDQGERVSSSADQNRAVNEVQNAIAREAQSGGSSSMATAATAQAGMSLGGLFASGSASTSMSATAALTAQFSVGTRNLTAASTNALSQRTAEEAQSLRSRRAAVVKEVSQREAENLSARVLANYNRRHALNIEYFEVLQLYGVETKLESWDRCLFVPLELIDFTKPDVVKAHKAALTQFFIESGQPELVEQLLFDPGSKTAEKMDADIAALEQRIAADLAKVKEINDRYATLDAAGDDAKAVDDALTAARRNPVAAAGQVQLAKQQYLIRVNKDTHGWLPPYAEGGLGTAISNAMGDCAKQNDVLRGEDGTMQRSGTIFEARRQRDELVAKKAALLLTTSERLMAEQLALSQAIWMRMDPFRIYRMLADHTLDGESLASLVEPYPVGVFGNYLAFRWGFEPTDAGDAKRQAFEERYLHRGSPRSTVTNRIAVPTSGVFAEAVLGRGQAAETIDDTRLWDWGAFPIPILPEGLAPLVRDRSRDVDLRAQDFAPALAQLRATDPADASHLDGILGAIQNGDTFRDMGGLAQAVTLADKVAAITGAGAQDAAARAAEIHAKILDTFVEVLNSDVGKAAVAEFMLPGAGPAVLQATGGGPSAKGSGKAAGGEG